MGGNKETSLRRKIKNPKQTNSSLCFFILNLDFNVSSAGLSIKADRRLFLMVLCVFETDQISRYFFLYSDKDIKRYQVSPAIETLMKNSILKDSKLRFF